MAHGQPHRAAPRLAGVRGELILVSSVATTLAVLASLSAPMQRVELMLQDSAQRLAPLEVPDSSRVVIVAIDDISYSADSYELGKWPWPRKVYPPVIDYLVEAGASVIGFDLYFPVEATASPEDDRLFVRSVALAGNTCHSVAALALIGVITPDSIRESIGARFGVSCEEAQSYPRLITPFPALLEACDCLGHVNVPRDMDGVARRVPLVVRAEGMTVPALSAAMYLWHRGYSPSEVRCARGEVILGEGARIPVDRSGRALLRFSKPHHVVPFSSVLHAGLAHAQGVEPDWRGGTLPRVSPDMFQDRIVLIALTASGLYDLVSTPLGKSVPGVEIQATALENIVVGGFVRPVWQGFAFALTFLLALLPGVALRRAPTAVGLGVSAAGGLLSAGTDLFLLHHGRWIALAMPLAGLALGTAGHLVALYLSEGREKRRYRLTFSRYVSKQVVEELLRDTGEVKLKGEQREITVMFCDIRGFTTLSETKSPEEVVALLDEFLSAMVEIVFTHGGTLDKFLGDGMMVFYGAPGSVPDHADRAVRTGMAMIRRLEALNREWSARGWKPLRLGIGINTGPAVVGSIGSKERMEYTAIGDTVNTASRVQALNKELGTFMLVTKATVDRLQVKLPMVSHGSRLIRGRQQEVEVFEPVLTEVPDA